MGKSIEIDTRAVNNPGRPDYWVANARQGQFASRYTKNLGRIQVLQYGSKHLYTNNDLTTAANVGVATNTLVKVGGQEFRVVTAASNKLILDEPYLGASIQPVTVDTGVTAKTGAGTFAKAASSDAAPRSDRIQVVGVVSEAIASSLGNGAAIYVNDCAMTINAYANVVGGDTATGTANLAADQFIVANTYASGAPRNVGVEAATDGGNDCSLSFLSTGTQPIYRRSDDTANQNLYKTTGDQAAPAATDMGVSFQRGSATGDITTSNSAGGVLNAIDLIAEVTTAGSETTTVTELQATASAAIGDKFYFHSHGPFAVDGVATAKELVFNGFDKQQGRLRCRRPHHQSAAHRRSPLPREGGERLVGHAQRDVRRRPTPPAVLSVRHSTGYHHLGAERQRGSRKRHRGRRVGGDRLEPQPGQLRDGQGSSGRACDRTEGQARQVRQP